MKRRSFVAATLAAFFGKATIIPVLSAKATIIPVLSAKEEDCKSDYIADTSSNDAATAACGTNHILRKMIHKFNKKNGKIDRASINGLYAKIRRYWRANPAHYAEMARKGWCHPNPETQLQLCWNMDIQDGFIV